MSLANLAQKLAGRAVGIATEGGIGSKTAAYRSHAGAGGYQVSGTSSPSYTDVMDVALVLTRISAEQANTFGEVTERDRVALVPAVNIPGITPSTRDEILVDGTTWKVEEVKGDAAGALWSLRVRS